MDNEGRKAIGVTPLVETAGADISMEQYRIYYFPSGQVRVDDPKTLWIKPPAPGSHGGGSHRVLTKDGRGVYIPYGWLKIEWIALPGQPAIAF